jgi:hypothetical protein
LTGTPITQVPTLTCSRAPTPPQLPPGPRRRPRASDVGVGFRFNANRHRLDRGGNRQLNCALHRLAINKGNWDPDSAAYLARKQTEGKSRKEALRCLKRHLARRVWKLLQTPAPNAAPAATLPTTPPTIAASAPTPMPRLI